MDRLRLEVREASEESGGGFEAQIFVNDVEMTKAGAGLGMSPTDLLLPENKLKATSESHQIAVARCGCGVYGCGSTDVLITLENDVVHWDWLIEKPMNRRVTFAFEQYSAEVDRFENDRSWETPEVTALRLITPAVWAQPLQQQGLRFSWASNDYVAPEVFLVTFSLNDEYQVFVRFPWEGKHPEELAATVEDVLQKEPKHWDATWHGITQENGNTAPPIAGPNWTKHKL